MRVGEFLNVIEKLTKEDIGRHVRRISTGEVDTVKRDDGNGWIYPGVVYEWRCYMRDLEFVEVVPAEPTEQMIEAGLKEIQILYTQKYAYEGYVEKENFADVLRAAVIAGRSQPNG